MGPDVISRSHRDIRDIIVIFIRTNFFFVINVNLSNSKSEVVRNAEKRKRIFTVTFINSNVDKRRLFCLGFVFNYLSLR